MIMIGRMTVHLLNVDTRVTTAPPVADSLLSADC